MPVVFDEGAADALIDAASHGASELRGEGILRRGAAETAADDFKGVYGRLFTQACTVESEDRGKLAGVLDDLADQVREAKEKAKSENARQEQLAAWNEREASRERAREQFSETPLSGMIPWHVSVFDPKPFELHTAPPRISVVFAPRERNRASDGGSSGKTSSADPDRLRTFVSQSRASNQGMSGELSRMKSAWARFMGTCSWIRTESITFLGGFDRLLEQNELDATWIDHVATAFEAAGKGTLTNGALNLASSKVSPMSDAALLKAFAKLSAEELSAILSASPGLQAQVSLIDPATINDWWTGLNPPPGTNSSFSEQQGMLLATFPVVFGNMEGIPYGARDYANQIALTTEISAFEKREAGLLETYSVTRYGTVAQWAEALEKVQAQLTALRDIQNALITV